MRQETLIELPPAEFHSDEELGDLRTPTCHVVITPPLQVHAGDVLRAIMNRNGVILAVLVTPGDGV